MNPKPHNPIVAWWSGGITSAVSIKLVIDVYGVKNVKVLFIDTFNEHPDTYRFKTDCEKLYDCEIETITAIGDKYDSIEDVWYENMALNHAHGAICSSELKRQVRLKYQKRLVYCGQVFGYDFDEPNRAKNLSSNWPDAKAFYPLIGLGLTKDDCARMIVDWGIQLPVPYVLGYRNNNCFQTGCVQGGVGYWQKIQRDEPEKFAAMARREHEITKLKGEPVTILKDQSKEAKESGLVRVFLVKHPDYPELKCIDDLSGREVEPLPECNGFCKIDAFGQNKLELIKKVS